MQERKREMWPKWRGLISEQGSSGQTIAAFCRDRGLTTSQFYTWRNRLRKSTAEQFLEVQVVKAAARPFPVTKGAIEIRLAEGRCVLVEPGFDPEHLRAVVAALEARG
jgi:transposase-like protein